MDGFLKQLQASSGNSEASKDDDAVTDADIEFAKHGLVAALLKRPDSLGAEAARIWTEIAIRRYDWSRPWELAKVVLKLSRSNCAEVLKQLMQPNKAGRRAAIEVWSSTDGNPFTDGSSVLHLDDAAAMREWKEKVGSWS